MSTAIGETGVSKSARSHMPSRSTRPAWALAYFGRASAPSSASSRTVPPASLPSPSPAVQRGLTPSWDADEEDVSGPRTPSHLDQAEAKPQRLSHSIHLPERSSSRLSEHLTQDQQDRQAVSNDIAGRRALDGVRGPAGPVVRDLQFTPPGREGGEPPSGAVTVHGWDDDDTKSTSTRFRASSTSGPNIAPGFPRLEPSKVYEELLRKESVRPPTFGGRSKNMQLGSVAESWGVPPTHHIPAGMFQLEDDPPSPPPGKILTPQEIEAEKARRALLGIPGEKSGRPSIKDMTKEVTEKLKLQRLREERVKSGVREADLRSEVQTTHSGRSKSIRPGWAVPARLAPVQPSLSDKLRERDVYGQGADEDDGW